MTIVLLVAVIIQAALIAWLICDRDREHRRGSEWFHRWEQSELRLARERSRRVHPSNDKARGAA